MAIWCALLDAWESGLRRDALSLAEVLTASLSALEDDQRERFAEWFCERLFDEGSGWYGQFGGGLRPVAGRFERPLDYALSMQPFTACVVVPYLARVCQEGSAHHLRWLYQCLIGMRFRMPPAVGAEVDAALETICGAGATPLEVLRRAALDDDRARRWLADVEAEDDD